MKTSDRAVNDWARLLYDADKRHPDEEPWEQRSEETRDCYRVYGRAIVEALAAATDTDRAALELGRRAMGAVPDTLAWAGPAFAAAQTSPTHTKYANGLLAVVRETVARLIAVHEREMSESALESFVASARISSSRARLDGDDDEECAEAHALAETTRKRAAISEALLANGKEPGNG